MRDGKLSTVTRQRDGNARCSLHDHQGRCTIQQGRGRVASYGYSFKMAQKDCPHENCLFTESSRHSDAAEGRCTRTAGYISNAEINEIIATGNVNRLWAQDGTNFLAYNDTEWVAFMDDGMKGLRRRCTTRTTLLERRTGLLTCRDSESK